MRKLSQSMQSLTSARYQLADRLMDTLIAIEQESGIFLIKPMFSFRGRQVHEDSVFSDYVFTFKMRSDCADNIVWAFN
jgi:hypothetical protein